jgi:adenosylcobinamide-phosphate synthase
MVPNSVWTAAGLLVGWTADQAFGDPKRFHPVAGLGQLAQRFEARIYADGRTRGVAFAGVLIAGSAGLGWVAQRATERHGWWRLLATATATWAVLGGRSLAAEADGIADCLAADDLAGARVGVSHLVSRDPESLDASAVARATSESVAENTCDAVVAPLFWGAVAGIPGLLGYRAINTLDAMVGYRNQRYRNFGWAAARIDDLANWIPARLSAGLAIAAAPLVGGRPSDALRAVREQSGQHPSPNGGVVEAAFAGALGVRLGGVNSYGGVLEDRGELGFGQPPQPRDVTRATKLAWMVSAGAVALAAIGALRR